MKSLWVAVIIALQFLCASAQAEKGINVQFGAVQRDITKVQHLLSSDASLCQDLNRFEKDWSRIIFNFVIFCRALHTQNLTIDYSFTAIPNYMRALSELKKGRFTAMLDAPWKEDHDPNLFYQSHVLLKQGTFVKGIYTLLTHPMLNKVHSAQDIYNYRAVSSKLWVYDWEIVKRLNLPAISVSKADFMINAVETGKVDYLLWEFPGTASMEVNLKGRIFVPLQGYKFILPASRHFLISKKAPFSEKIASALDKGLILLEQQGVIDRGLLITGIVNPQTLNWQTLCCTD